jgi:hypothetical protein
MLYPFAIRNSISATSKNNWVFVSCIAQNFRVSITTHKVLGYLSHNALRLLESHLEYLSASINLVSLSCSSKLSCDCSLHERKLCSMLWSSEQFFFQGIVSILWVLIIIWCGYAKCSILYKYCLLLTWCVLFVKDGIKHRPRHTIL